MRLHASLMAAACALALSACGGGSDEQPSADTSGTSPAADPAAPDGSAPGRAAGNGAGGEATVSGCSVDMSGNDMMRYDVTSITIPSGCSEFTINLTHAGRLPETAMGHNVVVTSEADMAAVAADGISAGAEAGYLKPGDDRIIAATEMIGGGESTSVTFDVSKMQAGGSYRFFCSFPGHAALMNGTIRTG